jgi:uncharacterized protein (DUF2267 family)
MVERKVKVLPRAFSNSDLNSTLRRFSNHGSVSMINKVKAVQKTLTQTNEWLKELMEVYDFADENKAFVLLRATLKALRDRISTDEAMHLGSALPALMRGYYFEGWNPNIAPKKDKTVTDFLINVRSHLGGHEDIDLEMAVPETMKLIFAKISQKEADEVKNNLPAEIQEFFS